MKNCYLVAYVGLNGQVYTRRFSSYQKSDAQLYADRQINAGRFAEVFEIRMKQMPTLYKGTIDSVTR